MADSIKVSANTEALNAALSRLVKRFPDLADTIARKAALDVVNETTKAITEGTGGTPKRVDTGRYRAGWREGYSAAEVQQGPSSASVRVRNPVEYGPHVEYGTRHMAPGNHLTRALEVVRRTLPGEAGQPITDAWEGKE
jgi:hypothetical protein